MVRMTDFRAGSKLLLIFAVLILLTGCWSRRELNELSIIVGIGVDWENGKYVVSYQVVNPGEVASQKQASERAPVTLYQSKGDSMFEAARRLTTEAPRKAYLGHLQLLVVGEKVARHGIIDVMDNLLRDNEARLDFNVIVAKGEKAENILEIYTPLEKLPTQNMRHSLETSERNWAPAIAMTMDEMASILSANNGIRLVLPGIHIVGDEHLATKKENVFRYRPPGRFQFTEMAVFKEGKLIGWLNEKESRGYTDLTDKLQSTSVKLPCSEPGLIGVEIAGSNAKTKALVKNGKPTVEVTIRTKANVVEKIGCGKVDLTDPDTIDRLGKQLEQEMRKNAEASLKRAKALKADIFGFGQALNRGNPQLWEKLKLRWDDEYFPQLPVTIHIKADILRTGTIGNTNLNKNEMRKEG